MRVAGTKHINKDPFLRTDFSYSFSSLRSTKTKFKTISEVSVKQSKQVRTNKRCMYGTMPALPKTSGRNGVCYAKWLICQPRHPRTMHRKAHSKSDEVNHSGIYPDGWGDVMQIERRAHPQHRLWTYISLRRESLTCPTLFTSSRRGLLRQHRTIKNTTPAIDNTVELSCATTT